MTEELASFSLKDAEGWQKAVEANKASDYGYSIITYAARWAHLMEQKMDEGMKLEEMARETSHEANAEGITGFMYGAAVAILARVWKHGEQLRRWHNLDTQIGTEAERANENGTTLNPALINIELPEG